MKKRLLSLFLLLSVMFSLVVPIHAASDHVYYSQKGWKDKNGKELSSMCYFTSFAMVVTNLGKTITPVDAYYANGSMSCDFNKLSNYYGLSMKKIQLSTVYGKDESQKRQAIIKELETGKYPAGFLVCGVTSGMAHMVVARKVVNGVIYCDDPAMGCCIPISETQRVSSYITSCWTFTKSSNWSSSGSGSSSNSQASTSGLSVKDSTSGNWTVTVPKNYKLLCYNSATAASTNGVYVSPQTSPYQISCTQKATLSNGTVRYYGAFNKNDLYWFIFANGMSVSGNTGNTGSTSNSATYTVSFNANEGSVSTSSKSVKNGSTYGTLPIPTRSNYTFDGWYTSQTGGSKVTDSTKVNLTGNQTLYAHWTAKPITYTVTFNANSGSVSTSSKNVTNGSTYGTLPTPTKNNYTFDGWYTAQTGGSKITESSRVNLTGNQTLYAHWTTKPVTYTITFDANDGNVSPSSKTYTAGSLIGNLPTPSRSGYTFLYWSTTKSGSGMVVSADNYIVNENATLYARWSSEAKTYTVYFNPLGGYIDDMWEKTVTNGEKYGQLPTPYYEGYSFSGWWTERDGKGVQRTTSSVVSLSSSETLYAKWVQSDVKVTYDPNGGYCKKEYSFFKPSGLYSNLPTPERQGYDFLGWYTKPSSGEKIQSNMTLIQNSDHTLYAHWEKVQETPVGSTLKIEGLRVDVSSNGFTPDYTITSNYSLKGATTEITGLMGDDYYERGSISLNPDMDIYELTGGYIYKNRTQMISGHTYRFEITARDISGATATASTTFTMP